jgi:hypothetical protein
MQNSLCKRVAKEFKLQRYIPEYQVYELCISWQSEIPIPPTIFYLSEIFIYPYTKPHELAPDAIKKETNVPNIFIESDTCIEQINETSPHNANILKSLSLLSTSQLDARQTNVRTLDYEKISNNRSIMNLIKLRKQEIVKHTPFKHADEAKKRKKV